MRPGTQFHHVDRLIVDIVLVERDLSRYAAVSIVVVMRFKVRRNVDLPHPDGPISAVTVFLADIEVDVEERTLSP